ncbi:MAG: GNAT family N-acetyltransferase [Polyangiales bacterium]
MDRIDAATLATLSDQNLLAALRAHARWQTPCELSDEQGLLMLAGCSDSPGAYRNGALRIDPSIPPADALARARAFFAARERGFTVFVRSQHDADLEAHLQSEGLKLRFDSPCMSVAAPLPAPSLPAGVRIEQFRTPEHVRDAIAINSEAYTALGMTAAEAQASFSAPSALLEPGVVGFVAYRGETPLSTAFTLLSGESAGVYWVGTAQAGARSGLATICTALATNAGFERGARVVTLQASPFGEPIYHRLGYQTYARVRWYSHRSPPRA